jgi:TolB-like protein/DNA-binding winged helix-turn-helix (wHTH) protein
VRYGSHAREPAAEAHDANVILRDKWLMSGEGLLNRVVTRDPEYASRTTALGPSAEIPPPGGRSAPRSRTMETGARVTGRSDNASGALAEAGGYRVGDLIVDVPRERVTREGREIPLAKLSFDLLVMLIRNAPDLVSVESLMQQVWPGLVVGPETVSQRIKVIREALNDDAKQPRYIAGVRGRGYRVVAPVEARVPESPHASAVLEPGVIAPSVVGEAASIFGWQLPTARARRVFGIVAGAALVLAFAYFLWDRTGPPVSPENPRTPDKTSVVVSVPTIAVLAFADMSPNKDQEYFADGLSEELSDHLSRLPGLRVIGRSSAFAFKGKNEDLRTIARALGVKHVLEGSVRKAGDQLRITAQLVNSNGTRVWSETYDQKLGDIFAIQNAVAKSVAVALSVTLTAGEVEVVRGGTRNVEAYDAYLAGKAVKASGTPDDIRRGIVQLERAVALDPQFALGWSELAQTSALASALPERSGAEWNAKALHATTRALEIAPDLPSVLTAAAVIAMQRKHWAEAERRLQRARTLAIGRENVWEKSAWFLATVGRPREAADYFRRAGLAEPLLAFYPLAMATAYEMSGDLDLAAAELARSEPLFGEQTFRELARLTQALARHDDAQIQRSLSTCRWNSCSAARSGTTGLGGYDVLSQAMRSHDSHAALAEVRRLAADPGHPKDATWHGIFAYWAAYLGDPNLALEILQVVPADPSFAFVLWRPVVKDVRRLPGFKNLVRDLGLVDYWRASGNWGQFCRPAGNDDFECT